MIGVQCTPIITLCIIVMNIIINDQTILLIRWGGLLGSIDFQNYRVQCAGDDDWIWDSDDEDIHLTITIIIIATINITTPRFMESEFRALVSSDELFELEADELADLLASDGLVGHQHRSHYHHQKHHHSPPPSQIWYSVNVIRLCSNAHTKMSA